MSTDRRFLAECEREALHLSGAIQPHGCLLVVDRNGRVSHVSGNIENFFRAPLAEWLGFPLPEALSRPLANLDMAPGSRSVHPNLIEGAHAMLDLVANRDARGGIVLEFVPADETPILRGRALPPVPDSFPGEEALRAAREALVEEVASLSGAHRVMYYEFRENGDGEVLAEAREAARFGSYLGLRFPASDIPGIARALYMRNPWRMIRDIEAESVPVVGRDADPPDLTWSDLRSVARMHRIYLANMGVRASLSFPVVVGGSLAALIAVHHREPLPLPRQALEDIARRVRGFGFSLTTYNTQRRIRLLDSLSYRFEGVRDLLRRHGDLLAGWSELAAWLLREFKADGATLCLGDDYVAAGVGLEPAALESFDDWFCERQGEFVLSLDSISRKTPDFPLSECAGMMAMRIDKKKERGLRLYLTRVEHIHEVAWGGNPDKPVEFHDGELGIAPRRSFEKWVETRLGYSRPWDNETRLLALKLRELLHEELRL